MKRTLTIITVLTLLTGALFAVDPVSYLTGGDKITLNATVAEVPPTFKFYGGLEHDFSDEIEGGPTAIINTNSDLTVGETYTQVSVRAYFRLMQTITSRYSGDLKVTFTATPFRANVGSATYSTKKISWQTNGGNQDYRANGVLVVDAPLPEHGLGVGPTYECTLKYGKNAPVPENTEIIQIAFQWEKEESLPAANYTATVSVKIEPTT